MVRAERRHGSVVVRRFFSIVFFVLGGWMLMGEVIVAFLDIEPGAVDNIGVIAVVAIFVLPLLLIGTWVSPGGRRRELGLTILIAVAFALFGGLSVLLTMVDPTMRAALPPMPNIKLVPVVGIANMLLLAALGWWLYRGKTKVGRAGRC